MANKIYEESHIQAIADAIREKNGTSNSYLVSEMSDAILAIESDGSESVGTLVESGQCGDNVTWKLYDDGILRIQGVVATYNYTAPGDEPENTSPFFDLYESIKNIIIEDGITYIGNWLFFYLHFVDSIVIPDGVYIIGEGAFYQCEELSTLHIPHSVTEIKTEAFNNCLNLQNVIYSGSRSEWNNISIGYNNLYILNATIHCEGKDIALQEKTITENGEYTADDGYDGFSSVVVDVPTSGGLYDEVYMGLLNGTLTEITIPNECTTLRNYAFYSFTNLIKVTLPDTMTKISDYAFRGCSGLKYVNIPNSVTTIRQYAFYGCTKLTKMTIPSSVTSLGSYAFYNCTGITDIYLYSTTPPIAGNATSVPPNATIHVPVGYGDIYKNATNWSGWSSRIVDDIVIE